MAQHLLGLELAHWPRQVIEIAQEVTRPGLTEPALCRLIDDAGGGAPVVALPIWSASSSRVSSPSKRTTLSSSGTWARVCWQD